MKEPSLARGETRLTGVIDTLSNGFAVVNQRPWLILVPILLDLFLWLGPQVSAARLISRTLGSVAAQAGIDPELLRNTVEAAEGVNLLSGLAPSLLGVPSFVAALGIRDPLRSVQVESWAAASGLLLGSMLAGMLLGALYYAVIAQLVRDGDVSTQHLPGQALRAWLRLLLYLLMLGCVGMLLGVPIGLLGLGAGGFSSVLSSLALSAMMVVLVWAWVYLFFVQVAVFLSEVGPMQAIRNSIAVVRFNFWGAMGIIMLSAVVLTGMGRVWDVLVEVLAGPWGISLSILGNAYVATGLIAASMYFYVERVRRLHSLAGEPSREEALSAVAPPRPAPEHDERDRGA